jgi:uncharacterized membrane protein
VPHGDGPEALRALWPAFVSYVLSFVYVGIYWNNHHHLFQAAHQVNGRILWSNLHLLFWLSLVPAMTGWMGEHVFAPWPVALYGVVLLMCGFAYFLLASALVAQHGSSSALAQALGRDNKTRVSIVLYLVAVPAAFLSGWIALAVYAAVALIWLVPDRRIERVVRTQS